MTEKSQIQISCIYRFLIRKEIGKVEQNGMLGQDEVQSQLSSNLYAVFDQTFVYGRSDNHFFYSVAYVSVFLLNELK